MRLDTCRRTVARFNALMRIAREAGYTTIGIGSDYDATRQIDRADVCRCDQHGLDQLERAVLKWTPLVVLLRWTHGAHRRTVLESFQALEQRAPSTKPMFVFAHIISPHPPFVFGPDGSPRQSSGMSGEFFDGDEFNGSRREYVDGYRDQVRFVTGRLMAFIEKTLRRSGPSPAIAPTSAGDGNLVVCCSVQRRLVRRRTIVRWTVRLPSGVALVWHAAPAAQIRGDS
jgi:hypothetical protein